MPHPKRRHSRTRRDKRRANWKLPIPNFSACAQCGKLRPPHRVCPHCGYYKNKPVVVKKEKEKKAKR
ncbi:MAG: 50S ribosomal protein L32 [Candidatus Omnitrophota bacterium]